MTYIHAIAEKLPGFIGIACEDPDHCPGLQQLLSDQQACTVRSPDNAELRFHNSKTSPQKSRAIRSGPHIAG